VNCGKSLRQAVHLPLQALHLDLVRGRPETPGDPMRRANVVLTYRQGLPTAVQYPDGAAKINSAVGN